MPTPDADPGDAAGGASGWPRLSALLDRVVATDPDLAQAMADRIRRTLPSYRDGSAATADQVLESSSAHIAFAVGGDAGHGSVPRRLGAARAEAGVPLPTVLAAYRVGAQLLWERVADQARRTGGADADDLVALASETWLMHDGFASALEQGWQEAEQARLVRSARERASVVDAVVRSTPDAPSRLWEALDRLGLPRRSGFVVVVVAVERFGSDPVPGVERRLAARRLASAWLLRAEMLVGVVVVPSASDEAALMDELAAARATAGVSPRREDWTEAGQAFRLASAACAASPAGRTTRFASSPIPVIAAAAPDVAREAGVEVLRGVRGLPEHERDALLGTLRAWFAAGGSTTATAEALFLHPNSVRNRLHRCSALTGRDLGSPADAAEVAVALAALDLR